MTGLSEQATGRSSDWAIELLRRRVNELDTHQLPVVSFDADPQLLHFISVMGSYTDTVMAPAGRGQPIFIPAEADEISGGCRLLNDITEYDAGLVKGPLPRGRQRWIGTGRHASSPGDVPAPTTLRLAGAYDAPNESSTKPFDLGLYTSTATRNDRSMWRTYLDSFYGSRLHPLPWYTWAMQVAGDAAVLEIASASEWAEFCAAYPREDAGMIYPDWRKIERDYDGIHLTLRAILATQGFNFITPHGVTAAAFWDVESTLWLRWSFSSARLLEITR